MLGLIAIIAIVGYNINMDKEILTDFINDGLSLNKIAEICLCSRGTIRYWMKKHEIENPRKQGQHNPGVKKQRECIKCGKDISKREKRNNKECCSLRCANQSRYEEFIKRWLSGDEDGIVGNNYTSIRIKRWIIETRGEKCEKCGWAERNPITGNIPISLHHIDGNWKNNRPENLQLLCPNDHSLTDSNGSLNRGRGRPVRYKRYGM